MRKIGDRNLNDQMQEFVDLQMEKIYSKKTIALAKNPVNLGRMNDPDGGAVVKGICGDTMEIYLQIDRDIIKRIKFFTDGCGVTLACGSALTDLVKGSKIHNVLNISPQHLIKYLGGLPRDGIHCAILAVCTLHIAISDYLIKSSSGNSGFVE